MEPRTEQGEKNDDGATSATPRIVNGMPYHPPKKISLRKGLGIAGLAVAPEFLLLLAIIPLAVIRVDVSRLERMAAEAARSFRVSKMDGG